MSRPALPQPKPGKDYMAPWDNAFFITINSNSTDQGMIRGLNNVWSYLTSHASEFFYGRPGARILDVKQFHRVEIGPKHHLVHLHGSLVVTTTGIAFLDYGKVNDFFNINLRGYGRFSACNFQAKLIKNYNQQRIIEAYIEKSFQLSPEEIS